MNPEETARKVVDTMFENDWFSQWLGIERMEVLPGRSVLRIIIRKEMLNGFGILHGGITFSLADSALAFASNSHGKKSVSIEASMSYIGQVMEGDILTATAEEASLTNKIGIYNITVTKEDKTVV
ncbi:MAG: hotdog fold thioesterase, partial [Bacteroidota bacterium]